MARLGVANEVLSKLLESLEASSPLTLEPLLGMALRLARLTGEVEYADYFEMSLYGGKTPFPGRESRKSDRGRDAGVELYMHDRTLPDGMVQTCSASELEEIVGGFEARVTSCVVRPK